MIPRKWLILGIITLVLYIAAVIFLYIIFKDIVMALVVPLATAFIIYIAVYFLYEIFLD